MNKDSVWEICPKCRGNGTLGNYLVQGYLPNGYLTNNCDVCNGAKIISKLTGKPPKK